MRFLLLRVLTLGVLSSSANSQQQVESPFAALSSSERESALLLERTATGVSAESALWRAQVDAGVVSFETRGTESPLQLKPLGALRSGWGVPLAGSELDSGTHTGRHIETRMASGITELVDLSLDGLELSYRFDTRPPGTGDLIVRHAARTRLQAPRGVFGEEGLRFGGVGDGNGLLPSQGSSGAVQVGAVWGVDANGERALGSLRFDGTHLDFVLPSVFVDEAAYPMVLDPLLGPVGFVLPFTAGVRDLDIVYNIEEGAWYFGWIDEDFHGDVWFCAIRSSGEIEGPIIEPCASFEIDNLALTYVPGSGKVLFAFSHAEGPLGPFIMTGHVGLIEALYVLSCRNMPVPDSVLSLDIGGSRTGNEALLVFSHGKQVRALRYDFFSWSPEDIDYNESRQLAIYSGGAPHGVQVSETPNDRDDWMACWVPGSGSWQMIVANMLRNDAALTTIQKQAFANGSGKLHSPDCTADGNGFAIAFVFAPHATVVTDKIYGRQFLAVDGSYKAGKQIELHASPSSLFCIDGLRFQSNGVDFTATWAENYKGQRAILAKSLTSNLAPCEDYVHLASGEFGEPALVVPTIPGWEGASVVMWGGEPWTYGMPGPDGLYAGTFGSCD